MPLRTIPAMRRFLRAGICEDDDELRGVLREALEREGFAVRATASGVEAVETFGSDVPDVLVLDATSSSAASWCSSRSSASPSATRRRPRWPRRRPPDGMDPISYVQAVVLGLLQGAAEPFPASSLGHAVILPRLLG